MCTDDIYLTDKQLIQKHFPNLIILKTLGPGDYFGYTSAEYKVKRTETVITKSDCDFITIESQVFLLLLLIYKY